MLAALLLAGMVAAPLGSIALFSPAHQHAQTTGTWPAIRRFGLAVLGTAVLAAAVAGALRLLHVSEHNLVAGLAGILFASLVWLPVTRRWNARAHLAWASTTFLFVVYLTYALEWTFASHLGPASTVGGVLLWFFEVFAAILSCAYLWEICDALGTEHWRRRITPDVTFQVDERDLPMISLHVPAHNEPPDMVIDTLRSLLRSNYPRYEVILIDDNTDDESLWRPVEHWCARHGVKFAHLADWPGYKSGALNYALRELTDTRAELIGVVDSDYQIEPGFLRRCAPAFADPWTGFVQSPQDYRDWQYARYYRRLYYSYKYFFAVSQPSRNEHNGAIFAGTMGLIRRVALDELGGWDEWCITEDAELSLRLLRAGWSGLHLDQSWGHGIMPLTFEALKGQRYRWCFGGIQILRMHWRSLLPDRKNAGESPEHRPAVGLPGRGPAMVRRPARADLPRLSARRGGQPRPRRWRAVPQADHVPRRDGPGAGRPRAGAGGRAAAPGDRRQLAGRPRCLLHLAVDLAGRGARVGARPVREEGGLPAHAQDERAGQVVGSAAGQLGRDHARAARLRRHRGRAVQGPAAQRVPASRAAAVPHARHGRRAGQQLGRPACRAAAVAAGAPDE